MEIYTFKGRFCTSAMADRIQSKDCGFVIFLVITWSCIEDHSSRIVFKFFDREKCRIVPLTSHSSLVYVLYHHASCIRDRWNLHERVYLIEFHQHLSPFVIYIFLSIFIACHYQYLRFVVLPRVFLKLQVRVFFRNLSTRRPLIMLI